MVLSSSIDRIPGDLWKTLLNSIIENFKRKNTKSSFLLSREDDEDSLTSGVISGHKSSFQKLSILNQKVNTRYNIIVNGKKINNKG